MKKILRKLFRPILNIFERDSDDLVPPPSARRILYIFSGLFIFLALIFPAILPSVIARGFWFPMLVFLTVGFTGLIVAALGSDGAVAKIWGARR